MQRLLTPCVVKYKDTATKTYLHLNAFLNSITEGRNMMAERTYFGYSELAVRVTPYITLTLSSPIDNSFTWLFYNIGGIPDPSSIPTEDNTIHFDTPRLSPAFVIAGVDRREKVTQPTVMSKTSDKIWETMSFHQKLSVWDHMKALSINRNSSLVAYWFRELFSATDVGNSPLWGGEIIKEIVSTIPTYHFPMPRIRKNLPVRSTHIDKLCPPIYTHLKIPISMMPIVKVFDTLTEDGKWESGLDLQHSALIQISSDITELWPIDGVYYRPETGIEVALSIPGDRDPETDDQADSFDMSIICKDDRWTIRKRYSDDRQRSIDEGKVIPPPIFLAPKTDDIPSLYLGEEFIPSMKEGSIYLDSFITDKVAHFFFLGSSYKGETTFIVGSRKDKRNGYLYTMMALSPTIRAIVEVTGERKDEMAPKRRGISDSIPLMTERDISPYFSILWDYISTGKNVFSKDVYISKPDNDEKFSEYFTLWKDISYFGIPVNTPFVEGYLRVILSAVYRYLLNDDNTIKAIVTILKEIPRDLFLRVNAPIMHTSEYLKQGRLGYFDLVLSTVFKPYIPHIITTYPYSTYKLTPKEEARKGDIVVFWNRFGREERLSTTHRIQFVSIDGVIHCHRQYDIAYIFSPNNSYEINTGVGGGDSDRMTGITVLRPPMRVPSLPQ